MVYGENKASAIVEQGLQYSKSSKQFIADNCGDEMA